MAAGTGSVDAARTRVHENLASLLERRNGLGRLLLVDPNVDAAAWQQHGALLAAVDRMRVEIEAAVRPASEPWQPPLVTERPREAVRRMFDAAAGAAAVAEAGAHAAASDLRALRRRAPDAETAADAQDVAAEAVAAAEAAAVAQSAAKVAADAAAEAAAITTAGDAGAADQADADRPDERPRR